jgi:Ran GTPase-activating protein (RanGAP) involved in mRNA processing and transport
MDNNNVAALPAPPALVAGLERQQPMYISMEQLLKHQRRHRTNKMEEICQRLATNDPTLTQLPPCTADGAYFNNGMPDRWRSQPTTTELDRQQVQEETELLLKALEHNTHLEDLILNFQSLSLVSEACQQKLIHFLTNNPYLKVLRLRIPSETPRSVTQRLLQGLQCRAAVQEVYLCVPGVLISPRISFSCSFLATASNIRSRGAACAGLSPSSHYQYQYQAPKEHGLTTISHFLANLTFCKSFHIRDSVLAPADMGTLSQGIRKNPSLKHVHLAHVTTGIAASSRGHSITNLLQGISQHATIQQLELVECHVGDDDWELLLGRTNSKLQHLRLQTCALSLESMTRLMGLLKTQPPPRTLSSLQRLEIVRATLNTACAALIADMLQHNTSLRHLVLQRTQLGSHEGALLAKGLLHSKNTRLESLSLVDNHISAGQEFQDLLQSSSTSLQHLDLSNNGGGGHGRVEESLLYIFQGLERKPNSTLQSLQVSNQTNLFQERLMELFGETQKPVRPQVVACLSKVLAHPSCALVALNLSYHRLGDANLVELCNHGLAQNTCLKRLELRTVGLLGNHASMECLGQALQENATLQVLDISGNKGLTQEACQVLAKYLTRNKGLDTLLFQGGFHCEEFQVQSQACATLLGPVLQENYRLTTVSYSESLDPTSRFYLEWNQHGRRLLFHQDQVPVTLWPSILGRVSQDPSILGAFLRCKADLLASVHVAPNRHRVDRIMNVDNNGGRKRKRPELPDATHYHDQQCVASVSP